MVKIVGCEKESVLPVCSQPLYISLDRLYELCLLLGGVGIVKTQIEFAVVFLGQAVVQQNTLGMSDMKISVGFRRETGVYSIVYALRQIFLNDLLYKILRFLYLCGIYDFLFDLAHGNVLAFRLLNTVFVSFILPHKKTFINPSLQNNSANSAPSR